MQTIKFKTKVAPPFSIGTLRTPAGSVFQVATEWTRADFWGMVKSRIGAFRMRYSVEPGLYAVGDPTAESDVFVTANYKLSFDVLRRELRTMNAWVLVLDTKSINVWCAAGKGTFGTDELVQRIKAARLEAIVTHRRVILPQLGAVGVNAEEVRKATGFRVSYGPVQARDIPAYVAAGYKKTPAMRTIRFPFQDRVILTPMEINPAMKKYPWFALVVLLLFGLEPQGVLFARAWFGGLSFLLLGLLSVFAGAFLTPALLPFIPFRSFALKGWVMGLLAMGLVTPFALFTPDKNTALLVAAWLFFPALTSYIALQFTGSTTFTGMTGVQKELRIGIPLYLGVAVVSLVLVVVFKLQEWRVI